MRNGYNGILDESWVEVFQNNKKLYCIYTLERITVLVGSGKAN